MKPRNIFSRKIKDSGVKHDLVLRPLDSDTFPNLLRGAPWARSRTRGSTTIQSPKASPSSPVGQSSAPGPGSDGPDKPTAQR